MCKFSIIITLSIILWWIIIIVCNGYKDIKRYRILMDINKSLIETSFVYMLCKTNHHLREFLFKFIRRIKFLKNKVAKLEMRCILRYHLLYLEKKKGDK